MNHGTKGVRERELMRLQLWSAWSLKRNKCMHACIRLLVTSKCQI